MILSLRIQVKSLKTDFMYIVSMHKQQGISRYKFIIGAFVLGESKNGFVISDHSDHGASKEPTNPCPFSSIFTSNLLTQGTR